MPKKEYLIEATGRYFAIFSQDKVTRQFSLEKAIETSEKAIADMLRYDTGRVYVLDINPENHQYTAVISSKSYTKARWDSFGIKTKEVEGTITKESDGSTLHYKGHDWFLPTPPLLHQNHKVTREGY